MSTATDLDLDIRSLFAPRPDTSVTEWAEHNIFLPSTVTQNAGQYSTAHCAYIRELLEDFRNPAVSESANCFAAQVFKTTGVFVGMGYRIAQQPANIMMVLPTHNLAQSFSQTKWQPIIESSPALLQHKQREQDKFKNLEQQFDNSILYFIGSGSENSLKGRSVEILVIDEIDDVEERWAKKGKSGVAMLESRIISYAGSKVIKTGTPKEVTGAIWKAFLEGDRRLFFVTCPECKGKASSKPFAIEFDPEYTKQWFPDVLTAKVVWDKSSKKPDGSYDFKKVEATAALECPCCKARLPQEKLPAMIANGRWIPTNANSVSGKISRRLPCMYSPHESCTLGKLAVKFLESKSTVGALRNFLNEKLAVPHQEKGFTVTENDIRAVVKASPTNCTHGEPYLRGTIPKEDVALLSLTVDVNADVLHWIVRAWFSDSSSALVDYGAHVLSWDVLTDISKRTYKVGSNEIAPAVCLIDSGWIATQVYQFCQRTNGRFQPVKGAAKNTLTKPIQEGPIEGYPFLKLIRFDDNALKQELYFNKIRKREAGNWFLPSNIGPDYEEQLTDEFFAKDQGKWDTKHRNNHLGDCEKYQLIVPTLIESIVGKGGLRLLYDRKHGKIAA